MQHKLIIEEAKVLGNNLKNNVNTGMSHQTYSAPYFQNYGNNPMGYHNVYPGPQYVNPSMMQPVMMSPYGYQGYSVPNGMGNPQQTGPRQRNNFDNNKNQNEA